MKKLLVSLIALVGLGVSGLAFAGVADGAGIAGSPHDFTDDECWDGTVTAGVKNYTPCDEVYDGSVGWNDSQELCRVCHIPHSHGRSAAYMSAGLLWNHDLSTVQSWTPYASGSLEVPAGTDPDGLSLACLGCHDGLSSISIFGAHSTDNAGTDNLGPNVIGGSGDYAAVAFNALRYGDGTLTNNVISSEHPVSVVYVDGVGTGMNALGSPFDPGRTIQQRLDGAGKVQCSSCHDVHNNGYVDLDGQYLLRLPVREIGGGEASELCLACHDK